MADKKDIAISKTLKISRAQQYMILSVLGATLFLGSAIFLTSNFIRQISFNTKVIMEEEKSMVDYTNVIKDTGVCTAPSGSVYSDDELKKCEPDSIEVEQVKGSLRYKILRELAANRALNSVPKEDDSNCKNSEGQNLTYEELTEAYNKARGSEELKAASQKIRSCSALRVIPDALPAYKNEEALLASLNKLFKVSNWEPETIQPTGMSSTSSLENAVNLNTISVSLMLETDSATTMNVLHNIEKSIREFNIYKATIEWSGDMSLQLMANATAYYMDESTITESNKTITEN